MTKDQLFAHVKKVCSLSQDGTTMKVVIRTPHTWRAYDALVQEGLLVEEERIVGVSKVVYVKPASP